MSCYGIDFQPTPISDKIYCAIKAAREDDLDIVCILSSESTLKDIGLESILPWENPWDPKVSKRVVCSLWGVKIQVTPFIDDFILVTHPKPPFTERRVADRRSKYDS